MTGKHTIYEVSVSAKPPRARESRRLAGLFAVCGVPHALIAESRDARAVRSSYYTPSRQEAVMLRRRLLPCAGADTGVSLKTLRDADWQTRWRRDFRPLRITGDIRVVPAWLRKKVRASAARDIYIDSAMAFGTGMHPSTAAVAGFMERTKGEFDDFLDIGTGTGILSIIADRYGARVIWSVDISPDAIATARRNFAMNRCRPAIVRPGDFRGFRKRRSFDFVAANILAPELIAMRDAIIARVRPGKYLAIAGIWAADARRFRASFETAELCCLQTRRTKGWAAFLYRKCGDAARRCPVIANKSI